MDSIENRLDILKNLIETVECDKEKEYLEYRFNKIINSLDYMDSHMLDEQLKYLENNLNKILWV